MVTEISVGGLRRFLSFCLCPGMPQHCRRIYVSALALSLTPCSPHRCLCLCGFVSDHRVVICFVHRSCFMVVPTPNAWARLSHWSFLCRTCGLGVRLRQLVLRRQIADCRLRKATSGERSVHLSCSHCRKLSPSLPTPRCSASFRIFYFRYSSLQSVGTGGIRSTERMCVRPPQLSKERNDRH